MTPYDWMNPTAWMNNMTENARQMYEQSARGCKTCYDQWQKNAESAMKSLEAMTEESRKASQYWMENAKRTQETMYQTGQKWMEQMMVVMTSAGSPVTWNKK